MEQGQGGGDDISIALPVTRPGMPLLGRGQAVIVHKENPDRRRQGGGSGFPFHDAGADVMDIMSFTRRDIRQRIPHFRLHPQAGALAQHDDVPDDQGAAAIGQNFTGETL